MFVCQSEHIPVYIAEVQNIVPGLIAGHIAAVTENSKWERVVHWVNRWMRSAHSRMLSLAFIDMLKTVWESAPSTTNAVERKNLDSKKSHPVHFKAAKVSAYKLDKIFLFKIHCCQGECATVIHKCYNAKYQKTSCKKS